MIDILKNIEWSSVIAIFIGLLSAFISADVFKRKKDADKHLTNLIKNDKIFQKDFLEKLEKIKQAQENTKEQFSKELNINSPYDIKTLEIKTESLKHELELLKLEILKKHIELLSHKLDSKDGKEIWDALNQKSVYGQANYLNNILKQSGSSEHISFERKQKAY